MRVRMSILLASLLLVALAGCKAKAKKMSEYPYSVEKLDKRWGVVRKSFQSDKPQLIFGGVLTKDLEDVVDAMERTYNEANRDEVMAKLKELTRKFKADMLALVDARTPSPKLMPDATLEDVGEAIERAYQEYQEVRKLLE